LNYYYYNCETVKEQNYWYQQCNLLHFTRFFI